MKTSVIKVTICLLIILFACFASYNAGKHKAHAEINEYFEKTEALLDSINNWDESFMDTTMETDAYYEYEVSRSNFIKK